MDKLIIPMENVGSQRGKAIIHGACRFNTSTSLYRMWGRMKERCSNPKKDGYHRYGGRGIKVCPEWLNNFIAFKKWALTHGYQKGLQIDRRNNDGNYSPQNCWFLTGAENTQNQGHAKLNASSVRIIKNLLGEGGLTHKEIASRFKVCRSLITDIKNGKRWSNITMGN